MSGALVASGGGPAANSFPFVVVTGNGGGDLRGFASGGYGTISVTTLKSQTVLQLTAGSSRDFRVIINGTGHPQTFFRQVVVEIESSGLFVQFTSASATFSDSGAFCTWAYGNGSGLVWTSSGITRRVIFFV